MPPKAAAPPSVGTMNLARAFHEHIQSLRSSVRAGKGGPHTTNVETLENLLQLTDNASHVLRGLLNGYRSINRLPSEILAIIFSFIPRPYTQTTQLSTFTSHRMFHIVDLLPITSTCHRWREVALTTSWLWSTVVDIGNDQRADPPFYTHYLDRCPTGPLRFLLAHETSAQTLSIVKEQGFRISEISMNRLHSSGIETTISTPLPALQRCAIDSYISSTPSLLLFPEGCPKLRTLSLNRVNFIPSAGFPSLTHLHISHATYVVPHTFSPSYYLFTFLSGCPNLRTLFLKNAWNWSPTSTETFLGHVALPRLERLAIVDFPPSPVADCYQMIRTFRRGFFAHVSIPPTCVVRIGKVLLSDLCACADLVGWTESPTNWRIYQDENIAYERNRTVYNVQMFNAAQGRYLQLDVEVPLDGTIRPDTALAQSSLITNAHEVWVDPEAIWLLGTGPDSLLSRMPHLESLVVRREPLLEPPGIRDSKLLQALEASESGDPLACPLLTTLRVDCMTDEDAVYVLQLSAARTAAGRPFARVVLGRTFQRRKTLCMLHQYDGAGDVIKVGNTLSDGLWDHWMSQLSPICLDESEDCEPYWRSWRWEFIRS